MTNHYVYRYLDAAGDTLYIGCTTDLVRRDREHRANKPWYPLVASVLNDCFLSRDDALAFEQQKIAQLQPAHNTYLRQGLPKRDRTNAVTITKTFNLPTAVALAIEAEARKQGHNNQSKLATEAMTEYFENHPPRKVF